MITNLRQTPTLKLKFMRGAGSLILSLAFVLILVEFLRLFFQTDDTLIPSSRQILERFILDYNLLWTAFKSTFLMAVFSLMISFLLSTILAFVFQLLPGTQKIIESISTFFQTVPIIAIAPLLVIFFGFGSPTVLAAGTIVSFFPLLAGWTVGLQRASQESKDLFKMLKATAVKRFFYLELPSAVPYLLSGFKSAAGLAVIGSIAGEFVAGGGLGSLIDSARLQQRVDLIFCGLILLALMGFLLIGLLEFVFQTFFKKYLYT